MNSVLDTIDERGSLSMIFLGFGVHIMVRSLALMFLGPTPSNFYHEITAVTIWAVFAVLLWGPDWIKSRSGKEPVYSKRYYSLLLAVAVGFMTSLIFLALVLIDLQNTITPPVMFIVGAILAYVASRRAPLAFS